MAAIVSQEENTSASMPTILSQDMTGWQWPPPPKGYFSPLRLTYQQ